MENPKGIGNVEYAYYKMAQDCGEIIDEITDVVAHWRHYAQESGVRESHIAEIERNIILISGGSSAPTLEQEEPEFIG